MYFIIIKKILHIVFGKVRNFGIKNNYKNG